MRSIFRLSDGILGLKLTFQKKGIFYFYICIELKSREQNSMPRKARRALCYIAVRKLGYKCSDVFKTLGVRAAAVSKAVRLGRNLPETAKIQRQILGA
jgi:hypothetical protein